MGVTPSPMRRTVLRILLTVAVIATVLPLSATPAFAAGNMGVSLLGTTPANQAITLGSAGVASPLGATQFTLELWFKRAAGGTTTATGTGGLTGTTAAIPLITKGRSEADGTPQDTNYFLGIVGASGTLAADFEDLRVAPSVNNNPVVGTTVITQNVWHHAAATYNGSLFCLYLDGVLDGTCLATTQTPRSDSIQIPAIGTSSNSTGVLEGFFAGQVDEARIWSVAKTQAQIQAAMNTEITTTQPNLLGRWGMNEGTGISVAGVGSAGVNGTLIGTPLPTWVSGPTIGNPGTGNNGLTFNGTVAQHVAFGAAPGLGATTFTIETWFNRTGAGVGTSTGGGGIPSAVPLVTKGRSEGADNGTFDMNYFLGIDTGTNRLVADYEEGSGQTMPGLNHPISGATAIPFNGWHHAAATFDGTILRLYLDGVLDGTLTVGANRNPRFDSAQHAALGTAMLTTGAAAGAFQGSLDEARIWSVARSQAEIQSAMGVEIVSQMSGLLGRWSLNEGAGTTAANTAGSAGVNGTVVGSPVWTTGVPGMTVPPAPGNYGVQFDGTNDYVTMGASPELRSPSYTVELWFRRTTAGVGTSTGSGGVTAVPLITKGRADGESANQDVNFFLGIDTVTGKLAADFEEAQSGSTPGLNHPIVGNTVVTLNAWHHAAATYDGTTWRLYLDGVADGSLVVNQPANAEVISATAIGSALRNDGLADGFFAGQIDEVRIWNTARSLAQIQGAMGSEITTGQAGLLGRWGMNEGFWTNAGSTGGTANGTLTNGPTWVAGTTFTPPNTAPIVDSVVINETTPRTNDTLSATVTSHDAEGNPITHAYQWTKNGTDIPLATNPTLNLATAGNGDKGDAIRVRVTASDASLTSPPLTSAPVTILNTAPTATVSLDDHAPGTNASLTATATKADVDGDTVGLTYVWTVNGGTVQTTSTTALTDTLDLSQAGNGNNGDTIVVTVTPNDGTANGTAVTDTATVGNATPVVDSVTIDQTDPLTNDSLSATVTSHDADNDPLTTDYQWTLDGSDISGATDPTLDLSDVGSGDKGDLIRVRVTVSDAGSTSAPVTSSPVTVANTAPTATVSLDDHSPGTNATLTATATGADDDADAVTFTYLWTVNGDTKQTTTTSALTDTFDLSVAGNGDNGQTVVVTVTPNDGTANGSGVSDTATVGNGTPVVDSVAINEASPRTNDTLSVTVTSHDPDGDPLTTDYQWTLDGNDIAGANDPTLDLAGVGNGDKGDLIRVRVTVSDAGSTSAPITSSPVTILNTAPSATVTLNDHSPSTNATLTATATASDVDGDPVSLTYVWTVNGGTVRTTSTTALTDALDLSQAGNGDNGQTVVVTVTPNDGTTNGASASDSATVGNEAPVVDTVTIVETTPRTNDTLSVAVTSHDPDGNPVTYAYHWSLNGTDISGATDPTLDLSLAGNGDKGNLIRVRVTAFDGSATSAAVTSSPVTVLNTAPTATVSLNDHSPNTNATLTATATRADVDGDTVSLTYVWTVNGTTRQTTTASPSLTDTFDLSLANHGNNGDTVVVTVTPNDGTANGSAASDTATVGNAAPVVNSVVIDQATPRTNDTLSATVVATDPDGGTPTPSYHWTLNGNDIAGATNATLDLSTASNGDKGDLIRVRVTVSDGSATSAPVTSSSVTILNTAPTATVSLNDHTPGTNATLTATATRADVDGDAVSLTYLWTVNGTTRKTTTTANLTDTFDLSQASNGNAGDTVVVTVTPNDGTANGSAASDTATVGNAAPVVNSVVINQATPRTNDTLSVTVSATDPDGGTPTPSYHWTLNGNDIAGATNATLDLSLTGNGNKGDVIRVRVTVSDGSATSAPVTSSPVTVLNTVPTATVSLNDHAPGSNATLTATAARADVDGDTVSLTYVWTVNGTTRQTTTASPSLTDTFNLSVAGNGDGGDTVLVTVTPNDGTENGGAVSDTATVAGAGAPPIFADEFANLNAWVSITRVTIDNAIGSPAPPSARVQVTGQTAFAYRDLGTTTMTPCMSLNVNIVSSTGADLFRLRTAANGPIIKAAVAANGQLQIRADFGGTTLNTGVQLGTGWHSLELCGTVGGATSWDLYRDGIQVVTDWVANTGTTPVGRIQIGDTAAKTFTANFDHVRLDLAVGEGGGGGDTQGPTTPGTPTGSSPSNGTIQISWAASTDASPPITYRIYRDGNPTSIGQTTSLTFLDPGLTPGTNHTYTVDAVDSLNNPSLMSAASASILVSGGDTQGPTTPGTPTGSSPSNGTIQISWAASTDASPPITYRVYRDGSPTSIGQTTSTTFSDPGLTPGTNHTYTVDAVDSLNNPSLMSGTSASITVTGPPDTQGPTTPGTPTGSSPSAGMIQITWAASTDASPPITYRVYRDGNPTSIGQTTSLTFMDPGLTPGTSHTYTVDAVDSLNNPSLMSGTSASILVSGGATPPIFSDEFANLSAWTSFTRITVDNAIGSPAAPSGRAQVTAQSAFAYRDLPSTTMTPCFSLNVNRASGAADLFRLRTAANGAIIKAAVAANGQLQLRSDFSGVTLNTGVALGTGWHSLELCGTVGGATSWNLYRDGTQVVTNWVANTGTIPVGRIQIGDTAAKTFTINFDHVRLDLVVGEGGGGGDTQGPTTPGTPTGSSPSNGTIQISWTASTDASPPITYRIYRDGNPTSIGQTTSLTFTDPGLTPATSHTYRVDAVDSLNNPSLMSGTSASITVTGPPDTQGPTTPGTPTGSSPSSGMIQITWAASSDASPPITYRIYRDGNPTSIGQTTSLTFMDPGLTPATSHTYAVDAVDSLNNPSLMSGTSASIVVSGGAAPPIFADDFSTGNLSAWTSFTRITIDNAIGSPAAPSARAQVTAQSAFAYKDLPSTTMTPCLSLNVNVVTGSLVDLFRLRTLAGGPVIKAFLSSTGQLQLRSDFSGTSFNSNVQLGTGWHSIELCGTVGGATGWNLYRDGTQIVTNWAADTGTTAVGRIQIGDNAAKTFTINFDNVRLDQVVG